MFVKIVEIVKNGTVYNDIDSVSVTVSTTFTVRLRDSNENISIYLERGVLYPLKIESCTGSSIASTIFGWIK